MPDTYVYLPVADPELQAFAQDWVRERQAKGKAAPIVLSPTEVGLMKALRRKVGLKVLRHVDPADKLYVLIHGAHREGYMGAEKVSATRVGGAKKRYDPVELATHMQAEGLTTQLVDLRLFACSAGLVPTPGRKTTPVPSAAPQAFADLFKQAMLARGYQNIQVTGYLEDLKMGYATVFVEHGDTPNPKADHLTIEKFKFTSSGHRAKHHKQVF